jgi:hypothetical protein
MMNRCNMPLLFLLCAPAAAFMSPTPAATDLSRTRHRARICAMKDLGSESAFDQAVKVVPTSSRVRPSVIGATTPFT